MFNLFHLEIVVSMRPKVIMHNQLSLDMKVTGFEVDMGTYYGIAAQFGVDATLVGSGTVLKAVEEIPQEEPSDFKKPRIDPDDPGSYVVIVDSKGLIRSHHIFRRFEMIKDVIVLVSKTTPGEYIEYLDKREYDHVEAGDDHVDIEKALVLLHERYGFNLFRVDAGGRLNSHMLHEGLIDEISIILTPELVGSKHESMFGNLGKTIKLELRSCTTLENGLLHLVYSVKTRSL
jgi:2,5-diamino-6-(ribosylamino)-4(3H)-pyrimidinone 5'-phosphate reductase